MKEVTEANMKEVKKLLNRIDDLVYSVRLELGIE